MSFWNSTQISKTKKQHKCEFCTTTIPVGASCRNEKGVREGEFQSYYLCNRCSRLLDSREETWVDTYDDVLLEFTECLSNSDIFNCPVCRKCSCRKIEYSNDMLKAFVKCAKCGHKYEVDLSAESLLGGWSNA